MTTSMTFTEFRLKRRDFTWKNRWSILFTRIWSWLCNIVSRCSPTKPVFVLSNGETNSADALVLRLRIRAVFVSLVIFIQSDRPKKTALVFFFWYPIRFNWSFPIEYRPKIIKCSRFFLEILMMMMMMMEEKKQMIHWKRRRNECQHRLSFEC